MDNRKYNRKKPSNGSTEHDFRHKKSLGQNFLADVSLLDQIVDLAGVASEDEVLELGTGLGSLTERLARRCKHVTTIEIDDTLIPILKVSLGKFENIMGNSEQTDSDIFDGNEFYNPDDFKPDDKNQST